ncbi:MAG: hypothetical protein GY811_09980 [Myxococcales bacterium]|nr:hypothetical protein [Myxococcales bacterium]
MRLPILAALTLTFFACPGGGSEDGDVVTAGLETPNGVERMGDAEELSVFPYFRGGHVAYLWIGDDVSEDCLIISTTNMCMANLLVEFDDEVILEREIWIGHIEAPLDGWIRRIEVPLDFSQVGFPSQAPLGEVVDVEFSLNVNGLYTRTTSAPLRLVEGVVNPESR